MNFFDDTQKIMLSIKLNFTYLKRNNKKLNLNFFEIFPHFCCILQLSFGASMKIPQMHPEWIFGLSVAQLWQNMRKIIVFFPFFMILLFSLLEKWPTKKWYFCPLGMSYFFEDQFFSTFHNVRINMREVPTQGGGGAGGTLLPTGLYNISKIIAYYKKFCYMEGLQTKLIVLIFPRCLQGTQ